MISIQIDDSSHAKAFVGLQMYRKKGSRVNSLRQAATRFTKEERSLCKIHYSEMHNNLRYGFAKDAYGPDYVVSSEEDLIDLVFVICGYSRRGDARNAVHKVLSLIGGS